MKIHSDKLIILTGGAGFIGSCLLRHLNNLGYSNLIIVDDLGCSEKWKNLVGKRFREIISKHELMDWLKGKQDVIEAFIHLGACSSTMETNADYLLENNTRYSIRLAEYALTYGHRFIYASSAATYGDGSKGFLDDESQLEILEPLNMYGYSKHLFDLWLKEQKVLDRVVGLKYFNVYGPNEYHKGKMMSAIVKLVPDVLKDGVIRLFKSNEPGRFKDGDQVRDFIYVMDAVRMTAKCLTNDITGIYNIGTGQIYTWNELARSIQEALNKPVNIEYIDMPKELEGKYQNYTKAEMGKWLKAHPDFRPTPLKEAVKDYVCNYLILKKYF